MEFSPLVSESHPRRKRLGRDSETRGENNLSHMETMQNAYHLKLLVWLLNVNWRLFL